MLSSKKYIYIISFYLKNTSSRVIYLLPYLCKIKVVDGHSYSVNNGQKNRIQSNLFFNHSFYMALVQWLQ